MANPVVIAAYDESLVPTDGQTLVFDANKKLIPTTLTGGGGQPLDSDLTAIAALNSAVSGMIASEGAGWLHKTYAQVKTLLGLVKADVGLGNVDNTTDAAKPVSTATQTALDAKQPLDSDLTTIAGLTATTDNFIVSVASAWASRTVAQVKTTLALVKGDVGLANVDNTADSAKPVSDLMQTALDLKAPIANPTFTGTVAGVTKVMVGLSNVDNTSDANKPVSTATQTALDLKAAALGADDNYATDAEKVKLSNLSGTNTGDNATNTQYSGLEASKQNAFKIALNQIAPSTSQVITAGYSAVMAGRYEIVNTLSLEIGDGAQLLIN